MITTPQELLAYVRERSGDMIITASFAWAPTRAPNSMMNFRFQLPSGLDIRVRVEAAMEESVWAFAAYIGEGDQQAFLQEDGRMARNRYVWVWDANEQETFQEWYERLGGCLRWAITYCGLTHMKGLAGQAPACQRCKHELLCMMGA